MSSLMALGTRAMFAAYAQLNTVSHNIANANTPGYSRQQTVQTTAEQVVSMPMTVVADRKIAGKREIAFVVEAADGSSREDIKTSFFGPMP